MKIKLLLGFLITLLICIGLSNGAPCFPPYPLYGEAIVAGITYSNVEIHVVNLNADGNNEFTTSTNEYGQYMVDLGNFPDCYRNGDTIRISFCEGNVECVKTFVVKDAGKEIIAEIPISEVQIKEIIKETVIIETEQEISDEQLDEMINEIADKLKDKIEVTPGAPIVNVDTSGIEALIKELMPDNTLKIIMSIIGSLLVIAAGVLSYFKWFVGFKGLVNYYKKLGDEAMKRGDVTMAKKHYERAAKMIGTAVKKGQAGKYKK